MSYECQVYVPINSYMKRQVLVWQEKLGKWAYNLEVWPWPSFHGHILFDKVTDRSSKVPYILGTKCKCFMTEEVR